MVEICAFNLISLLRLLLFVYLHCVCIEHLLPLDIVQVDVVFPFCLAVYESFAVHFYIYFKVQDTKHAGITLSIVDSEPSGTRYFVLSC